MACLRFYARWLELRNDYPPREKCEDTLVEESRNDSWQSTPDNGILTGFETEDIPSLLSSEKVAQMSFYQQILYRNAIEISEKSIGTLFNGLEHHKGQLFGVSCHIRDFLPSQNKRPPSES
jgi:hypothetical protein